MAYTTINKSTDYFNTKLYTGNNGANAITGVGFQPDFVWLKPRNYADHHRLMDAVRGQYTIYSNRDVAQDANSSHFTSFDSDGFTLGSDTKTNGNGSTYASWNWKANGQGSSNTDGSINTTYTSANTTNGFSISTYTGTGSNGTIGHGLGAVPKMFIVKRTDGTDGWYMFNSNLGSNDAYIMLDSTNASSTSNGSTLWNSTAPTNQVFSLGTNSVVNYSGRTYVAYCFAEKTGFSKFGSYEGNASTNGSFINTGFKPAFVMMKGIDSGGSDNWNLCDNKRVGYNAANWRLYPNATAGENTTSLVDLLSNGFKLRVSSTDVNADAKTYIYMAFAEAPLVGSNNVPANAR